MKRSHLFSLLLLLCFLMTLSSCAPEGRTPQQYGFLYGLLHGFILLFAVIGKLFGLNHGLYAVHNTGFLYWLGYLIGMVVLGGGGSKAASR